jgi:hypothetical protein
MRILGKRRLTAGLACGICGMALVSMAAAAPPASRSILGAWSSDDSPKSKQSSGFAQSGFAKSASARLESGRLDLRAPTEWPSMPGNKDGKSPGEAMARADATSPRSINESVPFPSAHRTPDSAHEDQHPSWGADEPAMKSMSQAEEFARRVHREGLPVARLWQGHTALVSLGLNQRGKPGIWLIQKVH